MAESLLRKNLTIYLGILA
jgi:hypothetical protein